MIAAVTGAGGFIGRPAVEALRAAGFEPRTQDTPETFDIAEAAAHDEFFSGADVVVHLAGPPSVAQSLADPVEFARAHVVGTAAVIEGMRRHDVPRIVYISSAEVYGDAGEGNVRENAPLAPRSPYGAAKAGAELLLRSSAVSYGLQGFMIRPFSVYGPNASATGVMRAIIEQARRNGPIILNDLAPVRDYCFVEDLAHAIVRACEIDANGIQAINVGTGIGTSVLDLARTIDRLMNGSSREILQRSGATRASEIYRLVADISVAREVLGWMPRYDLAAGLARTLAVTA